MADFSRAQSQHQRDFVRRHVELNRFVKLITSAIDLTLSFSSETEALSTKITELILNAGERWTTTILTTPHDDLRLVRRQAAEMAIVRVYSSFDVFTSEISGSYNNHKNDSEPQSGSTVEKIYRTFGWNTQKISYLFPVLNFYEISRNCIAHQMGVPNAALSELANGADFQNAMKNWPTVIPGRTISPPPSVVDGVIDLSPHHPITYSDVCLRVVRDIDQNLFETLGLAYFARLVGKRDILAGDGAERFEQDDAYKYIKHQLNLEFNISGLTVPEIRSALGGEELCKEYFHKYERIKSLRKT